MDHEMAYRADSGNFEDITAGRRRWLGRVGLAALVVALILGGFAFYRSVSAGNGDDTAKKEEAPHITVVVPRQTSVEGLINVSGTLAARRQMPVGVAGEGGRIVSVPVDAGNWVSAGQVLAVIDRSVQTQQSYSASAQIAVARADAQLAQANLNRASQLAERGFVSKADIERLTATRDGASARLRAAQAQAGELNARTARLNIVAPASGLVLARNVEPGQVVGAGSPPLFLIAKGGEMELLAKLGEADLARVSVGVSAEVTPTGFDTRFKGQIWQLAPMIDPQNRQGTARIALGYDAALRPGGFAKAVIKAGTTTATLLPESAVMSDAKGSYVFIVDDKNKVRRRGVTIGSVTPRGIALSNGLSGNERVVLRAGGFLTAGETVVPNLQKLATEQAE